MTTEPKDLTQTQDLTPPNLPVEPADESRRPEYPPAAEAIPQTPRLEPEPAESEPQEAPAQSEVEVYDADTVSDEEDFEPDAAEPAAAQPEAPSASSPDQRPAPAATPPPRRQPASRPRASAVPMPTAGNDDAAEAAATGAKRNPASKAQSRIPTRDKTRIRATIIRAATDSSRAKANSKTAGDGTVTNSQTEISLTAIAASATSSGMGARSAAVRTGSATSAPEASTSITGRKSPRNP